MFRFLVMATFLVTFDSPILPLIQLPILLFVLCPHSAQMCSCKVHREVFRKFIVTNQCMKITEYVCVFKCLSFASRQLETRERSLSVPLICHTNCHPAQNELENMENRIRFSLFCAFVLCCKTVCDLENNPAL